MPRSTVVLALLTLAAVGATAAQQGPGARTSIKPGEECPPGTTETRPGSCQAPDTPPPSIVDYRPKSTLVTDAHPVPKAKFPGDRHARPPALADLAESIASVVAAMDTLNLRVMVSADNSSGDRLTRALQAHQRQPAQGPVPRARRHRLPQRRSGMGREGRSAARSRHQGRRRRRRRDRQELRAQHSQARWQPTQSRRSRSSIRSGTPSRGWIVPVFIHTAEPQEFFQPLDFHNERWLELALFANRRNNQPGQVTFEELMTERNNLFRKHPKTRFIAAHFGWHANDLKRAAALLDTFPNVVVEVGAILYDLGRQPRAAREFFIKYQDRDPVRQGRVSARGIPVLLARVRDSATSISTTTATITPSGSCTGWTCPTTC